MLLLVALASSVHAYASTPQTMLTKVLDHPTETAILACIAAGWSFLMYKFFTRGVQPDGTERVSLSTKESDFMKYGTSFPTPEQKMSKELYRPAAPAKAEEAPAPVHAQAAPEPIVVQDVASQNDILGYSQHTVDTVTPQSDTLGYSQKTVDEIVQWVRDEQCALEGY